LPAPQPQSTSLHRPIKQLNHQKIISTTGAGEHVVLNVDMASVHGGSFRSLEPGDPLAEFAFFTETANLQVTAVDCDC
jgi:hypothetical protein